MRSEAKKSSVPEGLWHKCPSLYVVYTSQSLRKRSMYAKCQHHMRINARTRLDIF